ncbi:MAG: hypothetical protein JRI96_18505, partial [Deltaproteobacteria bacterium]|nr:hypothetical protein [Deltaproteobacteria bacterium]
MKESGEERKSGVFQETQKPYFKPWIRAVALVIVAAFLYQDIVWAVGPGTSPLSFITPTPAPSVMDNLASLLLPREALAYYEYGENTDLDTDYRPTSYTYQLPAGSDLSRYDLMGNVYNFSIKPYQLTSEPLTLHMNNFRPQDSYVITNNGLAVKQYFTNVAIVSPTTPNRPYGGLDYESMQGRININFMGGPAPGFAGVAYHCPEGQMQIGASKITITNTNLQTKQFGNFKLQEQVVNRGYLPALEEKTGAIRSDLTEQGAIGSPSPYFIANDVESNPALFRVILPEKGWIYADSNGVFPTLGSTVLTEGISGIGAFQAAQNLSYSPYRGKDYGKFIIASNGVLWHHPQQATGTITGLPSRGASNALPVGKSQMWWASSGDAPLSADEGFWRPGTLGAGEWVRGQAHIDGKSTAQISPEVTSTLHVDNQRFDIHLRGDTKTAVTTEFYRDSSDNWVRGLSTTRTDKFHKDLGVYTHKDDSIHGLSNDEFSQFKAESTRDGDYYSHTADISKVDWVGPVSFSFTQHGLAFSRSPYLDPNNNADSLKSNEARQGLAGGEGLGNGVNLDYIVRTAMSGKEPGLSTANFHRGASKGLFHADLDGKVNSVDFNTPNYSEGAHWERTPMFPFEVVKQEFFDWKYGIPVFPTKNDAIYLGHKQGIGRSSLETPESLSNTAVAMSPIGRSTGVMETVSGGLTAGRQRSLTERNKPLEKIEIVAKN